MNIDSISQFFIDKIGDKPISIHLDFIGLLRLGKNNKQRLENFREILLRIEEKGGTVLVPTYSMSYTKKEIYDIKYSPSEVGTVTEFLREKDYKKRTSDPLFSYLIYSKKDYSDFFKIKDFDCFGENSLVESLYKDDAFLSTLGCGMRMLTEIYFLEKKIGNDYRYDKAFEGTTLSLLDEKIDTSGNYFCRNVDKYPNLLSNFITLQNDLTKNDIYEKWNYDDMFFMNVISFKKLEDFILKKIKKNPLYLTIDRDLKHTLDKR